MSRALQYLSKSPILAGRQGFAQSSTVHPFDLRSYIQRFQHLERLAHDIGMWRDAIREAEQPWRPSRVKMVRMTIDTVENPYIKSVIERWEDLTLQRNITIYQNTGGKIIPSKDLTQALTEQHWVKDYIKYTLNAQPNGYSLIQLGDCDKDSFPNIESIPRELIVPDGAGRRKHILTPMTYGQQGVLLEQGDLISDCNHFIGTENSRGNSTIGNGWLYNIAMLEIHLRHIMEWNADFVENYAQPIKVGSTNKQGEARNEFEDFLASGSSDQWILLDRAMGDDIKYEMAAQAGTAWKSYENLEQRLQAIAQQLILGHADAMASTPGKLGGMQKANSDESDENLIERAMNAKKVRAGDEVCKNMNMIFAPRMRRLGKYIGSKTIKNLIPEGYTFGLQNDSEDNEIKRKRNAFLISFSTSVKNFNDAGYNLPITYLEEWTGISGIVEAPPERKLLEERANTTVIDSKDKPNVEGTLTAKETIAP